MPFDQISAERQSLIHYRCSFGKRGGPFARLTEVIAPMDYLRLAPGLARYDRGLAVARVAKRLETFILAQLFTEMTARIVPILLLVEAEPDDAEIHTRTSDLAGRYDLLARIIDDVTASDIALGYARAA